MKLVNIGGAFLVRSVGVVVEYNPLHNGHVFHLTSSKNTTNADVVIAVMSGQFLQRGEPAVVPKHVRTKLALQAGADLVIELPYSYSTQHASIFAKGAISILDSLKCDYVCFGSEEGKIETFYELIKQKKQLTSSINSSIRTYLDQGLSYPAAYSTALQTNLETANLDVSLPNNILGIHYLEAIEHFKSKMEGSTIQRIAANYHDEETNHQSIASATAIRKILKGNNQTISDFVPSFTKDSIEDYINEFGKIHTWNEYFPYLKYKLTTAKKEELEEIYEAVEGLERRVLNSVLNCLDFEELMTAIKTKRYTWTRIQRLLTHLLTNTSKNEMSAILEKDRVPYIRLLGMSSIGKTYLNSKKKLIDVPIYTTINQQNQKELSTDLKATYAYSSILSISNQQKLIKTEYSMYPIIYDESTNQFSRS
ncbi:nucleotidyltransferase [Bacillus sp. AFS017336]|uniref:nucleotidyltransferase n=1 Tax=Bacillus sp. AFS017336 TaxID=2033489 RepID=UPI00211D33E5|nr:nucleotidyltransferase [Bacillus sp. AFS017336]